MYQFQLKFFLRKHPDLDLGHESSQLQAVCMGNEVVAKKYIRVD